MPRPRPGFCWAKVLRSWGRSFSASPTLVSGPAGRIPRRLSEMIGNGEFEVRAADARAGDDDRRLDWRVRRWRRWAACRCRGAVRRAGWRRAGRLSGIGGRLVGGAVVSAACAGVAKSATEMAVAEAVQRPPIRVLSIRNPLFNEAWCFRTFAQKAGHAYPAVVRFVLFRKTLLPEKHRKGRDAESFGGQIVSVGRYRKLASPLLGRAADSEMQKKQKKWPCDLRDRIADGSDRRRRLNSGDATLATDRSTPATTCPKKGAGTLSGPDKGSIVLLRSGRGNPRRNCGRGQSRCCCRRSPKGQGRGR